VFDLSKAEADQSKHVKDYLALLASSQSATSCTLKWTRPAKHCYDGRGNQSIASQPPALLELYEEINIIKEGKVDSLFSTSFLGVLTGKQELWDVKSLLGECFLFVYKRSRKYHMSNAF